MSEYAKTTGEEGISGYHTGQAVSAQIGYLFENNVELAARYTALDPDDVSGLTQETQTTIGLSKYIVGHSLKLQTDYTLSDKDGKDDFVHIFRAQMEMQF